MLEIKNEIGRSYSDKIEECVSEMESEFENSVEAAL